MAETTLGPGPVESVLEGEKLIHERPAIAGAMPDKLEHSTDDAKSWEKSDNTPSSTKIDVDDDDDDEKENKGSMRDYFVSMNLDLSFMIVLILFPSASEYSNMQMVSIVCCTSSR